MGTFSVNFELGDEAGTRFIPLAGRVAPGVSHTAIPEDLLASLGVAAIESRLFSLPDNRELTYPFGYARLRLDNRELIVPVVFLPTGAEPLLGVTTLAICGLRVDPLGERLLPARNLLKALGG